jgi:hypothetical protein
MSGDEDDRAWGNHGRIRFAVLAAFLVVAAWVLDAVTNNAGVILGGMAVACVFAGIAYQLTSPRA